MADLYSYALTSVSDVKETLGIASSDHSKDNLITRKINAATDMIENYCGRRFALTTYTNDEYDATHTNQLILRNRPVVSFTSLGLRDTSQNEDDWDTTDVEDYFVDSSSGVIDMNFNFGGSWNRMRASYTAGYAVIPADLAEAAATLAAYLVSNPTTAAQVRVKEEGARRVEYYSVQNTRSNTANALFDQLGLTGILASYSNMPLLADK